jgi:transcription elongation factor Elf1
MTAQTNKRKEKIEMPEIRRCPFCGSHKIKIEGFDNGIYVARCQECSASSGIKMTYMEARTSWNMRTSLKEEALQVAGKISLSCPKCGTRIQGEIKQKYNAEKETVRETSD